MISEDSTRFSVQEFKAVTGGTPGTAAITGYGKDIAQESKILTPDGFDFEEERITVGASPEQLAQHSPDSMLSAQLLSQPIGKIFLRRRLPPIQSL